MAEIIQSSAKKNKGVKKLFKKNTRVDLTPMVDLGFLLITFFVFTTTMAKPTAMDIVMPNDKSIDIKDEICSSCALTVLLGDDDKIKYYEGEFDKTKIYETDYTENGIRQLIQQKKKFMQQKFGLDKMVLIIKPMNTSTFKNFVDITDEAKINCVKRYYIDEPSNDENLIVSSE